jgi:hypothetical protein
VGLSEADDSRGLFGESAADFNARYLYDFPSRTRCVFPGERSVYARTSVA